MDEYNCIAIDLKSFYASVECVERGLDPLSANLVVADASRTDKTICLAVSPSLKACGVPGRPRLFEVKQKLEEYKRATGKEVDFIIAPPRMAEYIRASSEIFGIYLKYVSSQDIHVYSIDECFMYVKDYLKLYNMSAYDLAMTMIKDVLRTTGITATAGIGTNLYLCKIAMDIVAKKAPADEDGVRIAMLNERDYRKSLWGHRPLTDFWHVGRGIERRLARHGIQTMGDLARASVNNEDILYKEFGIDAEILIDHAWGYEPCKMSDIKSYRTKSESLSSGQVLHCGYENEKAKIVVWEMAEMLSLDLFDKELVTASLTLAISYDHVIPENVNFKGDYHIDHYGRISPTPAHGSISLITPTSSTDKITSAIMELYERITDPALLVRRINITANNVTEKGCEQLDFFTDPKEREKEERLQRVMLDVKKRFGKNAILKAANLQEGATAKDRNAQIGGHRA